MKWDRLSVLILKSLAVQFKTMIHCTLGSTSKIKVCIVVNHLNTRCFRSPVSDTLLSGCGAGCAQCAFSHSANYPSSRWPRKWADILFMRGKIHFAEPSRDPVTPVQILTLDNCLSFKFHLIWLDQNQTPLCGILLGCDCSVWWMCRGGWPLQGGAHRGTLTEERRGG